MALIFERRMVAAGAMLAAVVMVSGCGRGSDQTATTPEGPSPAVQAATGEVQPYPLDVCIVSGEPLGSMGDPIAIVVEGRELKICCAGCRRALEADPAAHLAKLDAAIAAGAMPEGGHPASPDHSGHGHGEGDAS